MDPLEKKWLGFVIYLRLRMHQFQKYCLKKKIRKIWMNLGIKKLTLKFIFWYFLVHIPLSMLIFGKNILLLVKTSDEFLNRSEIVTNCF